MHKCKANLQGQLQKPWKAKSVQNLIYICSIQAEKACNHLVGLSINEYLPKITWI